ncbi:MAG: dihydrofolate reductase [Erysipelotrichales bacterium]|nr:dihydrofolate reductase [Erysipelotrichales bacterium]
MISLIVALDKNGLIGNGNDLPWHYPSDLKYFRKNTLNKTLLMGSNTYQSIIDRIGKPLEKRISVVASYIEKKSDFESVKYILDPLAFIKDFPKEEELMIVGGKSIYELTAPYAEKLYLTVINDSHEGDCFLQLPDLNSFRLVSETNEGVLSFRIYERI